MADSPQGSEQEKVERRRLMSGTPNPNSPPTDDSPPESMDANPLPVTKRPTGNGETARRLG